MMFAVSKLVFEFMIIFDLIAPTDEYVPHQHQQEELDALKVPLDRRDRCGDFYGDFKKCIMV